MFIRKGSKNHQTCMGLLRSSLIELTFSSYCKAIRWKDHDENTSAAYFDFSEALGNGSSDTFFQIR